MGKRFTPPRALRRPLTSIQHGITRTDDYSWLRASDWHAVLRNPDALPSDIRAHLEAENAYTSAIMSAHACDGLMRDRTRASAQVQAGALGVNKAPKLPR